ncbi:MAG: 3-dehydroquinate synthase [archaeon]
MRIDTGIPMIEGMECPITVEPECRAKIADMLSPLNPGAVFIITDDTVKQLYGIEMERQLRDAGFRAHIISFPSGEEHKRIDTVIGITSQLLKHMADRTSIIIGLGGGVATDIAGFVASIFMRGIPHILMPTTLLGQVDASIGGKSAIDLDEGKNLIGSFHYPRIVLVDPEVLGTLPEDVYADGMVELSKHGIALDAKHFVEIEQNLEAMQQRDTDTMTMLIAHSIGVKVKIVEEDFAESGPRARLNYGHTFAHAIELLSDFSITHGRAVAAGMIMAGELSHIMGFLKEEDKLRAEKLIRSLLPLPKVLFKPEEILAKMQHDKKTRNGKNRLVLIRRIGESFIEEDVPRQDIIKAIERYKP